MKQEVLFSDLTAQMITDPNERAQITVRQHPEIDGPKLLDAGMAELANLGKLAIVDPVIFEVTVPGKEGEELQTTQYVASAANFGKLATGRAMSEVLAGAEPVVEAKPKGGNGGPKVDWTSPEHAGAIHKGRVTDAEAEYVRSNLEVVNARLTAAGERTIDPADPTMAKRYGFAGSEAPASDS